MNELPKISKAFNAKLNAAAKAGEREAIERENERNAKREQAQNLLAKISEAIVETVNEAPMGAPCGPLYMALMHVWPSMTSEQFNMLVATLVAAGKVERRNHCLYRTAPRYTGL